PRGRPCLPDERRRVQRGADPDLDRLEARQRGRPRSPAAAPGRVLPLLRRLAMTGTAASLPRVAIRDLRPSDWPEVSRIYAAGIATRNATFETEVPTWEAWDAAHLAHRRSVATDRERGVGWIALTGVSDRCCYRRFADHT